MDPLFPTAAFLASLLATRRSPGLGVGTAVAVGYVNGVVRANYLGVFTTFMFDAGLLGFYAGAFAFHPARLSGVWRAAGAGYVGFLVAWPAVMALLPVNDLLVQLVALRGTVWFLPVLLIATRFTAADVTAVARVLGAMNLVALAGGVYIYHAGVEAVYPENAVTEIIYKSQDVAGFTHHRVPSFFLSAHAYGGTMLYSLPFLLGLLFGPRVGWPDRALAAAGVAAAVAGILLCAARHPVVLFGAATLTAWAVTRFDPRVGLVAAGLVAAGLAAAVSDERLQRAASLEDAGEVTDRVKGSANESFFELVAEYPVGAGMGSSVGTSIPFFLSGRAPQQVGLENEFCRILVDQGWVGLGGWVAFLVWLFRSPPPARLGARWGLGVVLMYALCLPTWATGFIGTGVLSAVPASALMVLMMGLLIRVRAAAPGVKS